MKYIYEDKKEQRSMERNSKYHHIEVRTKVSDAFLVIEIKLL